MPAIIALTRFIPSLEIGIFGGVYADNAYSIGAGCNFQNGLTIEATYISQGSNFTIDLNHSYALGSGRMFDLRNWTSMHYGD